MDIGQIGHSGRLPADDRKLKRPVAPKKPSDGQKVAISEAARKAEEVAALVAILKTMPDVRKEIVEELKRKIASGGYPDADIIRKTADKLLSG